MNQQDQIALLEQQFLLQTYSRAPITIERGKGSSFWDVSGRQHLDFITGIGVTALGYSHPRIVRIIQEQAALCVHTSNLYYNRYQGPLAKRLAEWSGLSRVFFSNSGTEAVEAALKAVRAAGNMDNPRRQRVVALTNSFHGRTSGALAVTGQARYRIPFEPLLEGVTFVAANDVGGLSRAVTKETAAVISETVQGEGGIHCLERAFVAAIRTMTRQAGAFWIADETQCGLGRCGHRFAYQMYPEVDIPDIVVAAKPLAGGLPLGATMFSEAAAAAIATGMHGTTFGGGPLACRVALESLSVIDELLPHIRSAAAHLERCLSELKQRHPVITEVRLNGLMAGLQLSIPGHRVVDACGAKGLAINCTHDTVLRLLPPFVVTNGEIEQAVAVLDEVLAEFSSEVAGTYRSGANL